MRRGIDTGVDTTANTGEGTGNIVNTEDKSHETREGETPYIDSTKGREDNKNIEIKNFDIKKIAPQLKTEKNTAYFWSGKSNGKGGKDFAMEYANKNGGITLEGLMERKGIKMPTWDISDPNSIKAWDDASAEYAKQVSGVVKAIIGKDIRPDSTWIRIELPILKSNGNVSKIIIIDPDTLIETVIFTRR